MWGKVRRKKRKNKFKKNKERSDAKHITIFKKTITRCIK
jgi:hypothetical protein